MKNNTLTALYSFLLACMMALGACGGGGGSGNTTQLDLTANWSLYDRDSTLARSKPGSAPQEISSSFLGYRHITEVTEPVYNIDTGLISNQQRVGVLFRQGDGKMYRVNAVGDGLPVQVSTFTDLSQPCQMYIAKNTLMIHVRGADTVCDKVGDDIVYVVTSDMGSTTAPLSFPAGYYPLAVFEDAADRPTHYLARNLTTGDIVTLAANLDVNSVTTLLNTNPFDVQVLDRYQRYSLLLLDSDLYVYDDVANTLTASRHTVNGNLGNNFIHDSSQYYFSENGTVYYIPVDGSASAVSMGTETDTGSVELVHAAPAYVSYAVNVGTLIKSFKTMSLGDGSINAVALAGVDELTLVGAQGNYLYFNRYNSTSDQNIASRLKMDDGTLNTLPNHAFVGTSLESTSPYGLNPEISHLIYSIYETVPGTSVKAFTQPASRLATNWNAVVKIEKNNSVYYDRLMFRGYNALVEAATTLNSDGSTVVMIADLNTAGSMVSVSTDPFYDELLDFYY